jgi:hypothetical protein
MGGAAAVAAAVDDAVDRRAANPALVPLFFGKDLPQFEALCVSALSARVGGPCSTEATGPALPNVGMRFSPTELQAVVGDMTEALRERHRRGRSRSDREPLGRRPGRPRGGTAGLSRHSAGNDSRTRAA